MSKFRAPALTLGQQILRMRQLFPGFVYHRERNLPVWKGTLQPTPDSPIYKIRIHYRFDNQYSKAPKVWVESPTILPLAKHRYSDKSLCLYDPKDGNWTPYKFIGETIVPWSALWLLFYEIWLDTDHWFGPEAPHVENK